MKGHSWEDSPERRRDMLDLWTCSRCGARSGLYASRPEAQAAVVRGTGRLAFGEDASREWLSCEGFAVHAVLSS